MKDSNDILSLSLSCIHIV